MNFEKVIPFFALVNAFLLLLLFFVPQPAVVVGSSGGGCCWWGSLPNHIATVSAVQINAIKGKEIVQSQDFNIEKKPSVDAKPLINPTGLIVETASETPKPGNTEAFLLEEKVNFFNPNVVSFSLSSFVFKPKTDFFGIGSYFSNRLPPDSLDDSSNLIVGGNASWVREEFSWSQIEPERAKFNWEKIDKTILSETKHNLNVLGLIGFGNSWANWSGEILALPTDSTAFENYVSSTIERFDGDGFNDAPNSPVVSYWEIWNEENSERFWKPNPNPEQYARLLVVASKAAKEANPNAKIVFGGTVGIDADFISKVLQTNAVNYVDVIAVHPYSMNVSPEKGFLFSNLNFLEYSLKKLDKPIWITEIGWPSNEENKILTEDLQANFLVRSYVIAFTVSSVEKVFWYDFRNDGTNLAYFEENMGLLRRDFSAKKSFNSFKTLAGLLDGSVFVKKFELTEKPELQIFLFKNSAKNESYAFVWNIDEKAVAQNIELQIEDDSFSSAKSIDLVEGIDESISFNKSSELIDLNIAVSGNPKVLVLQK